MLIMLNHDSYRDRKSKEIAMMISWRKRYVSRLNYYCCYYELLDFPELALPVQELFKIKVRQLTDLLLMSLDHFWWSWFGIFIFRNYQFQHAILVFCFNLVCIHHLFWQLEGTLK